MDEQYTKQILEAINSKDINKLFTLLSQHKWTEKQQQEVNENEIHYSQCEYIYLASDPSSIPRDFPNTKIIVDSELFEITNYLSGKNIIIKVSNDDLCRSDGCLSKYGFFTKSVKISDEYIEHLISEFNSKDLLNVTTGKKENYIYWLFPRRFGNNTANALIYFPKEKFFACTTL